jgi:hypothetical protein
MARRRARLVRVKKPVTKWHAVTVVLHDTSCAAAALCRNTRFLSKDAPRLPLPTCPHPEQCRCTFRHHEDRRAGPRRTEDVNRSLPSEKPATNRRKSRGRRTTDSR